jgi:hypothetical protein
MLSGSGLIGIGLGSTSGGGRESSGSGSGGRAVFVPPPPLHAANTRTNGIHLFIADELT